MRSWISRNANWAALIVVFGYLLYNVAYSPHYQACRAVRLAATHGHFVPLDPNPAFGGDFLSEWTAGYVIRSGAPARLYDPDYVIAVQHDASRIGIRVPDDVNLFLFYPPCYYLFVTPFSLLSIQAAAILWYVLMIGCLAAAVALLVRIDDNPPWMFGLVLFACTFFIPVYISLNSGQKGTLWLLVFTAVYGLLRRQRPLSAGLVAGLLFLKPPLVLVLGFVMLWKRQWRFVAGLCVTALAALSLSLAMGIDVCESYVRMLTTATKFTLTEGYPRHAEHCWYGFVALLTGGQTPGLVRGLALLLDVATLGFLLLLFHGPLTFTADRFPLQFSGVIFATALISPKFLSYDLAIMLVPIFFFARAYLVRSAPTPVGRIGSGYLAVLLFGSLAISQFVAEATSFQISVCCMFGALLAVLIGSRNPISAPAAIRA